MSESSSKDHAKLKNVSDCFTEETLKNILRTEHRGKNAEVSGWAFSRANAKGDNYLSDVDKIKITGIVDGKEVETDLVVKSLPSNIGRRNTYRSVEFFRNEIMFYTKVIPKFEKFLQDKKQNDILHIPRHIISVMDGKNDYIALENVCNLGYEPLCRQESIGKDNCAMILKTLAKFHAISFAYKDQRKEEFKEIIDNINETYVSKDHWQWYRKFHENLVSIAKNALALEYSGSEAEKRFNSYKPGDLYHKAAEFCDRKYQPTSVVSHGDVWAPNFMARTKNGNDILMLDFQLARCSSPVLDISFCIYACTDKNVWDKHFNELLKCYHSELSNTISLLGSNPESLYSWNMFMNEVKEQFMFGTMMALEGIAFCLLDPSDAFDLDDIIKGETAVNIADVWTLSNIKSQSGRLRLANVFLHAAKNGFL